MIWIILSIGALNALIPLFVIIILIGAAGMSTRNFSFFNIFGIDTLFGFTGGQGKSSIRGKSLTSHTLGPKSVFSKQRHPQLSGVLKKAYAPQIKIGNKVILKRGTSIQYILDRNAFIKKATSSMLAGKSIQISTDPADLSKWNADYQKWLNSGSKGPPPQIPESELELLKERHPDHDAVRSEVEQKAANLRKVGLVIDIDKAVSPGGIGIRPKGKFKINRPYVVNKAENEYLGALKSKKGKGVAGREKTYASIAMAAPLWERQLHLGSHQDAFDKLSATTKQKIDELDNQYKKGIISERDFLQQKKQYIRKFNKQSGYFYDLAHRGMTAGELATAGISFVAGARHSINGDEDKAAKHFQKANEMLARGLIYKGGNTFGSKDDEAAQYKQPSSSTPQYTGVGNVISNEEELAQFKARKKRKEEQEKEDKEKAEKKSTEKEKKGN